MSWEHYNEPTGVPAIDALMHVNDIPTAAAADVIDLRAEHLTPQQQAEVDGRALLEARTNSANDDDTPDWVRLLQAGGSFILDQPETPPALWGIGEEILLADGEALMIAGGQGSGKTTLAQQLALGRAGFPEYAELLGYPIHPGHKRVLYLAMDRPRQAARSMRRMVGQSWRAELDAQLTIWPGPPPADLAKNTSLLTRLCQAADADTVIVDSDKDAAVGLSDDEVGAGWNRARQTALAAGIQVVELHHVRKVTRDQAKRVSIDDLYGSTWITSGTGSVILLAGEPGDEVVDFRHLKQPAGVVGPFQIRHSHDVGRSDVTNGTDLIEQAAASPSGITAREAAKVLFGTDRPDVNQKAQARRKLQRHVKDGDLIEVSAVDAGPNEPVRWRAK